MTGAARSASGAISVGTTPRPGRLRRGLRATHRWLTAVLIVGLVAQFYTAGLAAFGRPFAAHAALGWALIGGGIVLALLGFAGHGPARVAWLSALEALLLFLQPVYVFVLAELSIALGALHPVNGLAALAVAVWVRRASSS